MLLEASSFCHIPHVPAWPIYTHEHKFNPIARHVRNQKTSTCQSVKRLHSKSPRIYTALGSDIDVKENIIYCNNQTALIIVSYIYSQKLHNLLKIILDGKYRTDKSVNL